jgi:hypothetical protein
MRSLFDPRGGLGLSYLRQPMGASDFVAGPHYTYDDVPAGQTDLRLKHFSIAHDRAEILPLLRQALRLNPNARVLALRRAPGSPELRRLSSRQPPHRISQVAAPLNDEDPGDGVFGTRLLVGDPGLEPGTSSLSEKRSNRLS